MMEGLFVLVWFIFQDAPTTVQVALFTDVQTACDAWKQKNDFQPDSPVLFQQDKHLDMKEVHCLPKDTGIQWKVIP